MQVDWGMVIVWLVVIVPVAAVFGVYAWLSRRDKHQGARFLGIQPDMAILIIAIVLLLTIGSAVLKTCS